MPTAMFPGARNEIELIGWIGTARDKQILAIPREQQ
jgi:hypothetical protein